MVGGVVVRNSVAEDGSTVSNEARHFGASLGGGIDVLITQSFALRGQADWVEFLANDRQSINTIRTSVGAVFFF
jgi:hypothetical protein